MDDIVPPHPPDTPASAPSQSLSYATAGQLAARNDLREAVVERHPVILLFGETGVGKSTLIRSVLSTAESQKTITLYLSATSGEFVGPPTFDAFLDAICQRIPDCQRSRERPAMLAALASAVDAFAKAERTVVLAIDHADHLADKIISDLIKLHEYLDAAPESLVRIFIGSSDLAARLDLALRGPCAVDRRFAEIRLPQPSGVEVATLLAYEDMAQPGGPMLTPGAIDRISAYAKSNLHWAVPLADASRALALHQGEREVTPELVGGALLELWPPITNPGSSTGLQELSDVELTVLSASAEDFAKGTGQAPSAQRIQTASAGDAATSQARRRGWLWIALAVLVLATVIGIFTFRANDAGRKLLQEQPRVAPEQSQSPLEDLQKRGEQGSPEGGEESLGQKAMPGNATRPSIDEPAASGEANEPPAAALVAPEDEPKTRATSSTSSSDPTTSAPKPKVLKPVNKKIKESPSDQWIQTR